jgi:aryl sulfotransferase
MHPQIVWPKKQHEMVEWVIDSRPWNGFRFRDDDIIVCTWSKAGTTWMQQILAQLVLGASPDLYGPDHSSWIDSRLQPDALAKADKQSHRRFLKSHLPIESIVYSPQAKYIYIGRDIRDIYWSWHNHQANFKPEILDFIQSLPGQEPGRAAYPDPDPRIAFRAWLERDGYPCWPLWSHLQGWFDARHLPNLALFHFADLKNDLAGQIRRVADFLEIDVDPARLETIVQHCSIEHMRQLASQNQALSRVFTGGGDTFIHRGTNGRWRDVLTPEDLVFYEAIAAQHLSADCRQWLATGETPA